MSDLRSHGVALLRKDFAEEAAAGFPRLKRIPYTHIVWFLDYFAAQAGAEQETLLDGLARCGARAIFRDGGPRELKELEAQHPALARMRSAREQMGYGPGYRYTDVKMLSMVARDAESGGLEGWVKKLEPSALARQPRPDL